MFIDSASHRVLSILAFVCVGLVAPDELSAEPSVSLEIGSPSTVKAGEILDIDISLAGIFEPESTALSQYELCLAFDSASLVPYDVLLPEPVEGCRWGGVSFEYAYAQAEGEPSAWLRVRAALEPTGEISVQRCILCDGVLVTLSFMALSHPTRPSREAALEFFWRVCTDNTLGNAEGDTIAVAAAVCAADGRSVLDSAHALPSTRGPGRDCLACLGGDTVTVLSVLELHGRRVTVTSDPQTAVDDAILNAPLPQVSAVRSFPNPFNSTAVIEIASGGSADWSLTIFDICGRTVRTFQGRSLAPTQLLWDGRDNHGSPLPSGLYFARLRTSDQTAACKMLLLK